MAKGKKETEISVPVVINDKEKLQQQLRETILAIDKKLDDLQGTKSVGKNSPTQATMVLLDQYSSGSGAIQNLQSETNLFLLITAASKIRLAKVQYEETAELIGLKNYPAFMWSGMNAESLLLQFENRIKTVSNSNVISQLKAEKKKLEGFLSEEDRLSSTLQGISTLLKS